MAPSKSDSDFDSNFYNYATHPAHSQNWLLGLAAHSENNDVEGLQIKRNGEEWSWVPAQYQVHFWLTSEIM